ncbi:MAG: glycerate kinase [Verrucomicrobiota bacterium]
MNFLSTQRASAPRKALRILIVPDKFKGTLSAQKAALALARGWKKARPLDAIQLLPMGDGGDGFGEVIGELIGAKQRRTKTVDAAHRPVEATWWWNQKTKTAVIESAKVIGLTMLPAGKFHPFQLDTFGLGKIMQAAQKLGCRNCLIGIGGSATNDGGFGVARALGWKFLDASGAEIENWTALNRLQQICRPPQNLASQMKVTVAIDVQNPLLGPKGASRIYGSQKGLQRADFARAERSLKKFAQVSKIFLKKDFSMEPGAGAAGGLGFGLMAFFGAQPEPGFSIFSECAKLEQQLSKTDLVLTGEGALDKQTLMGKGVGQVALLCAKKDVPCIGIAGAVLEPKKAQKLFTQTHGLTELTSVENAKARPAEFLEKISAQIARRWSGS